MQKREQAGHGMSEEGETNRHAMPEGRRNEPTCAGLAFQFGVEGGDDEAAESGIELAGGRVTVVLAVGGVAMFPFRFLCGIFEDG